MDFEHRWFDSDEYASSYDRGVAGGGVSAGDIDGDGWTDLYLTRPAGGGRLYRNLGNFRFEDITEQSGLATDTTWSTGSAFIDIDNDGDLDLYVCGFDCPNRLFINDGEGRFEDKAADYGLDVRGSSIMMSFSDYDLDGDLDGFLALNRYEYDAEGNVIDEDGMEVGLRRDPSTGAWEVKEEAAELFTTLVRGDTGTPVLVMAGQYNRLYRNDGADGFSEQARAAGIVDNGRTLAATWWDHNADGWPDLYVSNDFHGSDRLYENRGDGTFVDVAPEVFRYTPWYSMGSDVGDVNNDGWLDLIATDMAGSTHFKSKMGMGDMRSEGWFLETGEPRQYMRNCMFVNTGTGPFLEVAHQTDLDASDWTWSPKFGDLDCDGRLDVFITNGMTADWFNSDFRNGLMDEAAIAEMAQHPKRDTNLAMRNLGGFRFEKAGPGWGLDTEDVSFGAALVDLDNDGDLDVVTNRFRDSVGLYRNHITTGHRVTVQLCGRASNAFGLGATVYLDAGGTRHVRYLTSARGYMSTNDLRLHFGLGEAEIVDRLEVRWPSGQTQVFQALESNRAYVVAEPEQESGTPSAQAGAEPATLLRRTLVTEQVSHEEVPYDDFAREPLLPNRLSQLGPGTATFDIDADGVDELWVGGAAGRVGRIYRFHADQGRYLPDRDLSRALVPAIGCEDMGAVFFDAEGDGDPDLYVVSGGVECEPGAAVLRDRLYLFDASTARFVTAPDTALPGYADSGSCVVAADFDRDGDLDLFVGGRTIPGRYPTTPRSVLLRNDSADGAPLFRDVTDEAAPGLAGIGMVTAAVWSDVDGDKDVDLLVALEWGAIRLYRNEDGALYDDTDAAGLSARRGWWNGLTACDFDGDGDTDFVATNFGLNTKYHPDPGHPYRIFYDDFDGDGDGDIVEAKLAEDLLLPVRGFS